MAVLPVAVRAECVAKEIEALVPGGGGERAYKGRLVKNRIPPHSMRSSERQQALAAAFGDSGNAVLCGQRLPAPAGGWPVTNLSKRRACVRRSQDPPQKSSSSSLQPRTVTAASPRRPTSASSATPKFP